MLNIRVHFDMVSLKFFLGWQPGSSVSLIRLLISNPQLEKWIEFVGI